jgi:hypothetical protein
MRTAFFVDKIKFHMQKNYGKFWRDQPIEVVLNFTIKVGHL